MRFRGLYKRLGMFNLRVIYGLFKRETYIKHLCHFYSRFNVIFSGKPRFICFDVFFDESDQIEIGNNVTIASGATLLTHDYAFGYGLFGVTHKQEDCEKVIKKKIHIGDNCFIGQRTIILPGTNIGDNTIIGAGSIVRGG